MSQYFTIDLAKFPTSLRGFENSVGDLLENIVYLYHIDGCEGLVNVDLFFGSWYRLSMFADGITKLSQQNKNIKSFSLSQEEVDKWVQELVPFLILTRWTVLERITEYYEIIIRGPADAKRFDAISAIIVKLESDIAWKFNASAIYNSSADPIEALINAASFMHIIPRNPGRSRQPAHN